MRRASLVVGAALFGLALVIVAVGPRTRFRAETSFTVSRPLLASDVVAELRLADVDARLTGAQEVSAETEADDLTTARRRVVEVVQRAVDARAASASTAATHRAAALQAVGDRAKNEAAAVSAASGVPDPDRAFRQARAELNR